jgi:hypothetical protein
MQLKSTFNPTLRPSRKQGSLADGFRCRLGMNLAEGSFDPKTQSTLRLEAERYFHVHLLKGSP